MKKHIFLFTLLFALCIPSNISAINFLVRVDDKSGILLRDAALASTLAGSLYNIPLNDGMTEASNSRKCVGFYGASTGKINHIRINGNSISKDKGLSIWRLDNQADWGEGCLVEVYRSGDPDRYEYPVNTNIELTYATVTATQRYDFLAKALTNATIGSNGQMAFHYGEYFELTTDGRAYQYGITVGSATERDNGNGTWTYRFTPSINVSSLTTPPTITLKVDNTPAFDEQFVVVMHGAKGTPAMSSSRRNIALDGHNPEADYQHFAINFNSAFDGAFTLDNGTIYDNEYVYINGTLISPTATTYAFSPAHTDILRIYNGNNGTTPAFEPARHDVEFIVAPELVGKVHVLREDIQDLGDITAGSYSELDGTRLHIASPDGTLFKVLTTPIDAPADTQCTRMRTNNAQGSLTDSFTLAVTQPARIAIYLDDATSGIDDLGTEQTTAPVYNLQGIKVMDNATDADLRALPAGLYIHGTKKVVVK